MTTPDIPAAWRQALDNYLDYLRFERNLSAHSIDAYRRDTEQLSSFLLSRSQPVAPENVTPSDIESFMSHLYDSGVGDSTQARTLSGIRSFFSYLLHTDRIDTLPTELIDSPRISRRLPDTLSYDEIRQMFDTIDLSTPLGHRNRAILEVLYSCGLRVSELVTLRLSDLFTTDGVIRVTGKGNKQRLVPIAPPAQRQLELYLSQRCQMPVQSDSSDIVFLNRNGRRLTRVMIFTIIRRTASATGITKTISPHTLRHSFATHLLQGGADIRAVQELLGHESILTTEIYTHLELRDLRSAIALHPLAHPSASDKNTPLDTEEKQDTTH